MKSTSAPIFGAALTARLQLSDAETRLMKATTPDADGRGLSLVLTVLRDAFEDLATGSELQSPGEWRDATSGFLRRVVALESQIPELGHDAEAGQAVPPPWLELQPSLRRGARLELVERLRGPLARAVLAAISEGRCLSGGWLKTWNRLHRRARGDAAAEFERVSRHIDWSYEGLDKLLTGIRDRQLSRFLADCMAATRLPMPSVTSPVVGAVTAETDTKQVNEHPARSPRHARAVEDSEEVEGGERERRGLLLPLLYGRSHSASDVERLGAQGRLDVYPPQALKPLCRRVCAAFDSTHPRHRDFAALFLTNINAPLPLERFLEVSLRFNADVWLDLVRGTCSWSLRGLLKRRTRNFQGPDWPLQPHEIIDMPLDERALARWRDLAQVRPDATNLQELLLSAEDDIVNFLQAAREFLKKLGDSAYHAHWSRAVRGFGQYLREMLGDLHAVFGACDTLSTPFGILHYTRVDRQNFFAAVQKAASDLSLCLASTEARSPDFGSRVAVDQEVMFQGLHQLDDIVRGFLDGLGRLRSPAAIAECFSAAMVAICLALVTLTLSRGTRLDRITMAQVHLYMRWASVADKRVSEDLDHRLIPAFALLEHFLALHLRLLQKFERRCEALGLTSKGAAVDKRLAFDGDRTAFFSIEWAGGGWRTVDLTTADLLDVAEKVFGKRAANVGRHYGVSSLFAEHRDSAWVGMLTNHGRENVEPFSAPRPVSRAAMREELVGALEQLFPASALTTALLRRSPLLPMVRTTLRLELPGTEANHPYCDPRRVIGPVADCHTTLALALCEDVVHEINQCRISTNSASIVLSLMIADGLRVGDVEVILATPGALHMDAGTGQWSVVWTRPGRHNAISVPLLPLTCALLRSMKTSSPRLCMPAALESAGQYLRARFPALPWPATTSELLRCFEQLCRRWWRHCVPGALELAAHPALDAATPSEKSLYRLGQRAASASVQAKESRNGAWVQPVRFGTEITQLLKAIRTAGNTSEVSGESQRRLDSLEVAIDALGAVRDPKARLMETWQRVEIKRERGELPGRPLDPASSVTYLRGILRGLSVLSFDGANGTSNSDNWRAAAEIFWRESEGGTADDDHDQEDLRQLRVHWRHFIDALAQSGHAVGDPGDLSEDQADTRQWAARAPASAHLVLADDWQRLRGQVPRRLDESPLGARRGIAGVQLLESGLRRQEMAAMRASRICSDVNAVVVTSEGASHLKSDAARRVPLLPAGDALHLREFQRAIQASLGAYAFLFTNSLDDLGDFDLIADAMTVEMVAGTGESGTRIHSGRGSVLMELHHPGWEASLRALYSGTLSQDAVRRFVDAMRLRGLSHIGTALVRAGQAGVVTPVVHYLSIWPAIRHIWLRESLREMEPSPTLLKKLECYDALRQARSRDAGGAFSSWDWLMQATPMMAPRLKECAMIPQGRTTSNADRGADELAPPTRLHDVSHVQLVRLALVVALEEDCEIAAEGFKLDAASMRLARVWAAGLTIEIPGEEGEPSSVRLDALRSLVRTPQCAALIHGFWHADAVDRADLLDDLSPFDGRTRKWHGVGKAAARLRRHLGCLAHAFSLQARFGQKHGAREDWGQLTALRPRLLPERGAAGRGTRPDFSIRDAKFPTNRVTGSRWTVIASLALAVVQRATSSTKEA
jgi:hypothetical protein